MNLLPRRPGFAHEPHPYRHRQGVDLDQPAPALPGRVAGCRYTYRMVQLGWIMVGLGG